MSKTEDEFDDNSGFETGDELLIDGDLIVFMACCVIRDAPIKKKLREMLYKNRPEIFERYDDLKGAERDKALDKECTLIIPKEVREKVRDQIVAKTDIEEETKVIMKIVDTRIAELQEAANCDTYRIFLTASTNFRDDLVSDYKDNRDSSAKPVTLAAVKYYLMKHYNSTAFMKLEADDLLGINMHDKGIIWSTDKDLRQIPGRHLDDATKKVITVTELGMIKDLGSKIIFDGAMGFYYQLLIGDTADNIIGCGIRKDFVYKSGAKKGKPYIKRVGSSPKLAFQIISRAALSALDTGDDAKIIEAVKKATKAEYEKVFGDKWEETINTQANLLFMVREQDGQWIKRWSFHGNNVWYNLKTKKIRNGDYTG